MPYNPEEQLAAFDEVIRIFKAHGSEQDAIAEASKITDVGLLCRLYAAIDVLMKEAK